MVLADIAFADRAAFLTTCEAVHAENVVLVASVDVVADAGVPFSRMSSVLVSLVLTLRSSVRSRADLQLEMLALRHQLQVLQRSRAARLPSRRPTACCGCGSRERGISGEGRSLLSNRKPSSLGNVRASACFGHGRAAPHRPTGGRADIRALIRTMSEANPLWGAPRIHGELQKLGIDICQATVAKDMARRRQPPSQTWRTFLMNHRTQLTAADFFVVPTVWCRLLFVLVMLTHDRRRVVHVAVTTHPTAAWTAQQLREAFPWDEAPRYLIGDRDHAFDGLGETAKAMGIHEVLTAPHAPWQYAFIERFIGSVRRECLDHIIVFNETGLQRLMNLYCIYYERSRTHLSLDKDTPIPRPVTKSSDGVIVSIPQVGGLHHRANGARPEPRQRRQLDAHSLFVAPAGHRPAEATSTRTIIEVRDTTTMPDSSPPNQDVIQKTRRRVPTLR